MLGTVRFRMRTLANVPRTMTSWVAAARAITVEVINWDVVIAQVVAGWRCGLDRPCRADVTLS